MGGATQERSERKGTALIASPKAQRQVIGGRRVELRIPLDQDRQDLENKGKKTIKQSGKQNTPGNGSDSLQIESPRVEGSQGRTKFDIDKATQKTRERPERELGIKENPRFTCKDSKRGDGRGGGRH